MAPQGLIYLDNCVYSNMLRPELEGIKRGILSSGHRVAFSSVHLTEMRHKQTEYSQLLNELDALFINDHGNPHLTHHSTASLENGPHQERFEEHNEIAPALLALENMLAPMHHLLGGLKEKEFSEIVISTTAKLNYYVELASSEQSAEFNQRAVIDFKKQIRESTNTLLTTDYQSTRNHVEDQVARARFGDPMRNMTPIEKVAHLFSTLNPDHRTALTNTFPRNFAQTWPIPKGEITSFAFTLFSIGLTKRKQVFSGPDQEKRFAAQFRDAMHIEEASRCHCFMTFDKGASEMAAATYAYAGIPTEVALIELERTSSP